MKKNEVYETAPHAELIVENGSITIPSIFMFEGDGTGLFLFVQSCRKMNCKLYFENEDLTIDPNDVEDRGNTSMKLSVYIQVLSRPKYVQDYINYLFHKDDMTWDKVNKEN